MTVAESLASGIERAEPAPMPRALVESGTRSLLPDPAASALAAGALAGVGVASFAPDKTLIFLAIAALCSGALALSVFILTHEQLGGSGRARARAALSLVMVIGQVGRFLLALGSGAMAQGPRFAAALAVLALVQLLVVVPAFGLRSR